MYWEHLVLFYEVNVARAVIQNELNHYGADRWMLVAVVYNIFEPRLEYYLRRELFEKVES